VKIHASDLWRWEGTIDRGPFAVIGLTLALLKYGLDYLLVSTLCGRPGRRSLLDRGRHLRHAADRPLPRRRPLGAARNVTPLHVDRGPDPPQTPNPPRCLVGWSGCSSIPG